MKPVLIPIYILFFWQLGLWEADAQDSSRAAPQGVAGVKVSAHLDRKTVPVNRLLKFIVRIEWYGQLERYDIGDLEDPAVTNFEIIGSSSSNRVEQSGGTSRAIKEFEFDLKPLQLGMGYVEGIIIKYTDRETGKEHRLVTNRLEAKVVEALPEPGSKAWMVKWVILFVAVVGAAVGFLRWRQMKIRGKRLKEQLESVVPLEQGYLQELKDSLNLTVTDPSLKESFSLLSRIFRRYLSEKYDVKTLEATTDQIIDALQQQEGVEEKVVSDTSEVLRICDLVKFAGGEGTKAELERAYTLVEDILEKNLESPPKTELEATDKSEEN